MEGERAADHNIAHVPSQMYHCTATVMSQEVFAAYSVNLRKLIACWIYFVNEICVNALIRAIHIKPEGRSIKNYLKCICTQK